MKFKKLLNHNLTKAIAILGLFFIHSQVNAQTTVSIDTSDPLTAFANWFELDGTTYVAGSEWGLADLKTEINNGDNTLTLYPNFSTYGTGDPGYWTNGDIGNKIFEGNTYIEDNTLIGQTVTFEGSTVTNTLAEGYIGVAFIKILSENFQLLQYLSTPLVAGQNFSLTSQTATIEGAVKFQYGYSVTGLNANPTQEAALGNAVVTAETSGVDPVNPTVSITTSSELIAFANWFELDGTTYVAGSEWGVADLQTVVDAENNVIDLHPNFSAYADEVANNPTENYWHVGEIGNKIFEGNTYVQDDALAGQTFTYTGYTVSNTLAEGYEAIAFIKVFVADYSSFTIVSAPLVAGETFNIDASPATGSHVQYGYSVTGLNANPNQEAALGYARVGSAVASVNNVVKPTVALYPNPVNNVLNIASDNAIESIAVYNLLGQEVMMMNVGNNNASINVAALNNGVYILNTVINGEVSTSRFIKK